MHICIFLFFFFYENDWYDSHVLFFNIKRGPEAVCLAQQTGFFFLLLNYCNKDWMVLKRK